MISGNIASDLYRRSVEVPDRVGLIFEDGRSLTFAQWEERAAKCAGVLAFDLGVKRGDRVALYLQNSIDLASLLFSCWKIGAVPITLSVMYNTEEVESALRKTGAVAIVTHSNHVRNILESKSIFVNNSKMKVVVANNVDGTSDDLDPTTSCVSLESLLSTAVPVHEMIEPEADDEGTILFTGGTTGLPKAVTVTHSGTRSSLSTLAKASKRGLEGPYPAVDEGVTPNLLALPLFHSGGQQALLFALYVGRSLVLMERFRVQILSALVEKYKIDNLFLMPTMLYDIVHAKDRIELASVRSVLIAGQALDPNLKQEFETNWSIPIFSNYGSTEIGHVAGWTSSDLKAKRWKPGPVGRIYDGVVVEIRDEEGSAVVVGQSGEIWVKASLSKGYIDEAAGNPGELVVDGWVGSGDIGYVDDNRLLYLVGRKRDMIKTGGFQVWPQEIELVLRTHALVADVAVVGIEDPRMGEIPKAFVVLDERVGTDSSQIASELIELCRSRLAHYKCIREVEVIANLPRSEAGKVQRGELANRSRN